MYISSKVIKAPHSRASRSDAFGGNFFIVNQDL